MKKHLFVSFPLGRTVLSNAINRLYIHIGNDSYGFSEHINRADGFVRVPCVIQ